jgi:hypothetical protein
VRCRDNLRAFFELCLPTLLKRVFGFDFEGSWLNAVTKVGGTTHVQISAQALAVEPIGNEASCSLTELSEYSCVGALIIIIIFTLPAQAGLWAA